MWLKRANLSAIMIACVLLLATGVLATPKIMESNHYGVEEGAELVYRSTHILWNDTEDYIPMERGEWRDGGLLEVQVKELMDLEGPSPNATLDISGTDFDGWKYEYPLQVQAEWPNKTDGPFLFMPVISLPNDIGDWDDIEDVWNAVSQITATKNTTHFELEGYNATLNISDFIATWNIDSGVLEYYWIEMSDNGPEGEPVELEVQFMYFRDPSQWGLGFGVEEGDAAMWSIDALDYNGLSRIPWGHDDNYEENGGESSLLEDNGNNHEERYLYEDDLMFYSFNELWKMPTTPEEGENDTGPYWRGHLMTRTFEEEVFMPIFGDDNEEEGGNGGLALLENGEEEEIHRDEPRFFMPLFVTGNDLLFGNLSDMMDAMGGDMKYNTTHIWLDLEMVDPQSGSYHNESAMWSRETGLLLDYFFDGFIFNETHYKLTEGEEDRHDPLYIEISFRYYINSSEIDLDWGINEGYYQRFIVTDCWNGTDDFITFGNGDDGEGETSVLEDYKEPPPFKVYDGDIFGVHFNEYKNMSSEGLSLLEEEEGDGPEVWDVYLRTSRGYSTDMQYMILPPGLEFSRHANGPPAWYFAFPIGDANWWGSVEEWAESVGYTVTNTASTFEIEGEGTTPGDDEIENIYVNVEWNKTDGVIEYYYVEANFTGDINLGWEMERGIGFADPANAVNWQWGVSLDHTLTYRMDTITIDGVPGEVPWTETANLSVGDTPQFWVTQLGILTGGEGSAYGAWMNMSGFCNGIVNPQMAFSFQEPGFEFPEVWPEDDPFRNTPPFMYFIIPIGDTAYWSLLTDMYEEAGYTVTNGAELFTVVHPDGQVQWNKTNGVLVSFDGSFEISEGMTAHLEFSLIEESTTPPNTGVAPTSEEPTAIAPGFEAVFILAVFSGVVVYIRRR